MSILFRRNAVCFLAIMLAGCNAMTTIRVAQPDAMLKIKEKSFASTPASDAFPATSFGQYEFKVAAPGREPFYGLLPLKFNGGYLVLDILFFAPATFFNLREVFPQYELDVEKGVIRYRQADNAEWAEIKPTPAEAERARTYFGGSR